MAAALPIDELLPDLIAGLRTGGAAVVRAPPGSGKTTRVPPALLDAGAAGGGIVLMLEPRRVAARAAARRIAYERHTAVGAEVGFQVRFEQQVSRQTRLKILTDGILIRLLHDSPYLEGVGAVVFDEFHERSLNADLALGMVRRLQQTVRPDLKIVVMSATLDVQPIAGFLDPCQVYTTSGTLFPVKIEYLPPSGPQPMHIQVAAGVARVLPQTSGDMLVFLPGVGEIRRAAEELSEFSRNHNLLVAQLYGDLPGDEQDAVLRPADRRRVILATNIAESSVTIAGVSAVVDSGYARVLRFAPEVGLDRLELARISRASADQRAGRAGRTGPGVCVRLWSERDQRGLADSEEPEVRRSDLAGAILQLACWGEPDAAAFPWLDPPPDSALVAARQLLYGLEAMGRAGPTPLGREMARLPVHPRIARLLIAGRALGAAAPTALAAALLAERNPFFVPTADSTQPRSAARHRSESDLLDRMEALSDFERLSRRDSSVGRLDQGAARFVLRARDQLLQLIDQRRPAGSPTPSAAVDEAVRRALLAAFPDRVARRREPGTRRGLLVGGKGVRLAERSAVLDAELFVCCDIDAGGGEALVRQASAIERTWLPAAQFTTTEEVAFDAESERVVARRQTAWNGLVLDDVPAALPGPNRVEPVLAAAAAMRLDRVLPLADDAAHSFLARVHCLRGWMPELDLPPLDNAQLVALLPTMCCGCKSFDDLRRAPWSRVLPGMLTASQRQALDRETPERLTVPSGSQIAVQYQPGRPPILAVRIQELFGLAETPRIAGRRVAVVLHLLGPNYRPQQITDDLRSFWNNTYPQVRKDLRRRYPKHAWPEDPWNAAPERKPNRRKET